MRVAALVLLVSLVLVPETHADPRSHHHVCMHHWSVPSSVLRRAILWAADRRVCIVSDGLAAIVSDERVDALTRSMAAATLGENACHRRRRDGLSDDAIASLLSASVDPSQPALVRQASVRALGRAGVDEEVVVELEPLRNDADPILALLAAQSLTRITGTDYYDAAYRNAQVTRIIDRATRYHIHEVTP